MLRIICVVCVAVGCVIMSGSIYKYSKCVIKKEILDEKTSYYRVRTYKLSMVLMCFFLCGYIGTLLLMLISADLNGKDFLIALIFFFGAVFVDVMIEAQKQMLTIHAKEILATVTDNLDSMIHVVDPTNFEILFVNQTLARNKNRIAADYVGATCWKTIKSNQTEPCANCPAVQLDLMDPKQKKPYYWESEDLENGKIYFVTSSYIRWVDDREVLMCSSMDISQQKKHERALELCAKTDKLTKAFSRTWAHRIFDTMFLEVSAQNMPFTFCFFDLDKLKAVNDTYGHDAGDVLLCSFVRHVKANIRAEDILVRWGGDEFVLLLHCNAQRAQLIVEKIEKYIRDMNTAEPEHLRVEFSYGIEEFDRSTCIKWETALSAADLKMYQQKTSKRLSS